MMYRIDWQRAVWRIVPVVALPVLAVGCSDPVAPYTVLETETMLSATSIGPQDSVQITVTIINPTSTPVVVTTNNSCLPAYQVTAPTGSLVRRPSGGSCLSLTIPHFHRFSAGDSVVKVFTWSLGGFTETAMPGGYLVQGGWISMVSWDSRRRRWNC